MGRKGFTQPLRAGAGFTILELLTVIAIIGIIIVLLMPFVNKNREQARRLECANNLRRISIAFYKYAADNKSALPVNLSDLYPRYIDDVGYFTCPSDVDASEISPDGLDIDTTTSYVYASGWTIKDPLDTILVCDKNYILEKDTNHRGEGGEVLYLDGNVKWVETRDWVNPVDKE